MFQFKSNSSKLQANRDDHFTAIEEEEARREKGHTSSHSIVCKSENEAHSDENEVQGYKKRRYKHYEIKNEMRGGEEHTNNSPIRHQDLNDGGDMSDSILNERSTGLFLRHFYSSKNRMCQI